MYPLVSIITPAYNSARHIRDTIRSVQAQSYANWELLVIDDCSDDDTAEIVTGMARFDNRIKLTINKTNVGIGASRNVALNIAQGRFLAFLDHDDIWSPGKLERQIPYMLENDCHFTFTEYDRVSEDGKFVNHITVPKEITYKELLKNTIIGCLTVVIDRDFFKDQIRFDETLCNDFSLWLQLLKIEKSVGIQESHAKFRIVRGSASQNKFSTAASVWYTYKHIEKLSLPYSIYCFSFWVMNATVKRLRNRRFISWGATTPA